MEGEVGMRALGTPDAIASRGGLRNPTETGVENCLCVLEVGRYLLPVDPARAYPEQEDVLTDSSSGSMDITSLTNRGPPSGVLLAH